MEHLYLIHHGIKGQEWGVQNGPPYPLTPENKSKSLANNAKKNEPKITSDLNNALHGTNSKLIGLENKFKTEASLSRKLETKDDIKDALRYTVLSDNKNFYNDYSSIKKNLESKGYEETRCKNYFTRYKDGTASHKQITTNYKSPGGYTFEIQFHTDASYKAKNLKVPLYEEARKQDVDKKRKEELIAKMKKLADNVTDPPQVYEILEHSYLIHHGIKGQEWGVQNGPPYPLDRKSQKLIKKRDKILDRKEDHYKKYAVTNAVTSAAVSTLMESLKSGTKNNNGTIKIGEVKMRSIPKIIASTTIETLLSTAIKMKMDNVTLDHINKKLGEI